MKILVISLLRLGDLLMQKHLLAGLLKKYPNAEIHFLIRSEFQSIEFFFPEVKKFFHFDGLRWQSLMQKQNQNILRPLKELTDLLDRLNNEKFNLIMNWTHQKGSAYLVELIDANEKLGLQTRQGQFFLGDNIWLKEFNNHFGTLGPSKYHYLEYLSRIFEIELQPPPKVLRSYVPGQVNRVIVQPLTSDAKKNWALKNFRKWIQLHRENFPLDLISLIGSPSESQILHDEFKNEHIHILSLADAYELLLDSHVLVTGDTAIKHLGAWAQITTIELALGSAQPSKTGAWQSPQYVLEPKVSCHPCPHTQNCSQSSHLCGEALSAESIENLFFQFQGGNKWETKQRTTFPQL